MRFRPLLLIIVLVLLAVPASALADGGNITGTVYLDGIEGSGLCVDVFDGGSVVASQLTNAGGEYNLYVAQPGSYTVRFSDCGQGYTTTQWYPSVTKQEDATAVQVVSDAITPQVNGSVNSAGRVTGKVKDTLDAVITGACVRAEDQSGSTLAETTTDGNGDYALGAVPPGPVTIRFSGCTAGNYVVATSPVTVEAGTTKSGIDAVLTPAGRISGHVENADGEPLPGMCVTGTAAGVEVTSAVTDSNGDYVIREVPPSGTYDLSAYDCYGDTYMGDFHSGQLGGVVNQVVNFTLPRPGFITGHVRDGNGKGLASICVTAKGADNGATTTDANGYYELNRLHPGTYDLSFNAEASVGGEAGCSADGDWAPATTTGVVLGDGATLWDVDKTLAHPIADPGGHADPGPSDDGAPAGDASGGSPSGDGGATAHPSSAHCTVPKLVGLSLAKAKKSLAKAGCALGKVSKRRSRTHAKRGKVLEQRAKRGSSRPAGFKVAVTVAR